MSLEDRLKQPGKKYRAFREIEDALTEKPHDSQARIALGNLIHSITPQERASCTEEVGNDKVDNYLVKYKKILGDSLNEVVDKHYQSVLGLLDKERLMALVFSTIPYKTGNKEHDEVAELHEEYMKLQQAVKTQNVGYYLGLVKNEDARDAMAYGIETNPERVLRNMAGYAKDLQRQLIKKLGEKGEAYIRSYLSRNYNKSDEEQKKNMNIAAGALVKDKKED